MPHDPYKALYLHMPFCKSRCHYCDFQTNAVKEGSRQIDSYVEYLVEQVMKHGREGELSEVETVYVGGGTPTFAKSKALSQLLYAVGLAMPLTDDVECTIEGNPDSIDERLVADIWALGANRLSIGVQSFDDGLLETIGRVHTADDAKRAIEAAQTRFENISVDLMCGLPGQTLEQLDESLSCALEAGVKHVSIYPLTIERGTKFDKMMRKGKLHIPDDDLAADMMELAASRLQGVGMERYEVASYAYPGYESRHNISYWTAKPYLGIGESAVTMTQNDERRMRTQDGHVTDDLGPAEMKAEDLMLAMRMSRGVSDEQLAAAQLILPRATDEFERLASLGLVRHDSGRWTPTDRGWLLGNELYTPLLSLAS